MFSRSKTAQKIEMEHDTIDKIYVEIMPNGVGYQNYLDALCQIRNKCLELMDENSPNSFIANEFDIIKKAVNFDMFKTDYSNVSDFVKVIADDWFALRFKYLLRTGVTDYKQERAGLLPECISKSVDRWQEIVEQKTKNFTEDIDRLTKAKKILEVENDKLKNELVVLKHPRSYAVPYLAKMESPLGAFIFQKVALGYVYGFLSTDPYCAVSLFTIDEFETGLNNGSIQYGN